MRKTARLLLLALAQPLLTQQSKCPPGSPIALAISNSTIASQNSNAYGIRLDVSNPKENLVLSPSTVVSNVLLVSANRCEQDELGNLNMTSHAQCVAYRGGLFSLNSGFKNISMPNAEIAPDEGWTTFNPAYSVAGETDLGLVSDVQLNMPVVGY